MTDGGRVKIEPTNPVMRIFDQQSTLTKSEICRQLLEAPAALQIKLIWFFNFLNLCSHLLLLSEPSGRFQQYTGVQAHGTFASLKREEDVKSLKTQQLLRDYCVVKTVRWNELSISTLFRRCSFTFSELRSCKASVRRERVYDSDRTSWCPTQLQFAKLLAISERRAAESYCIRF